ncbi:MAG: hypothetical protein KAT54_06930, partial [Candidatus Marinimicrobia bacterium]|nr:hypothetical protein [Candidatus Neomarinimicrobiota bacterium]
KNYQSPNFIAVYIVLWAWKNNIDSVIIRRENLMKIIGAEQRIRQSRLSPFIERMKTFFPYIEGETHEQVLKMGEIILHRQTKNQTNNRSDTLPTLNLKMIKKAVICYLLAIDDTLIDKDM